MYEEEMYEEEQPKPIAEIVFNDGPCDGLEMRWPQHAGDFPAVIVFGHYEPIEAETKTEIIDADRVIRLHRYEALDCWTFGEVLEDGIPQHECQSYLYAGNSCENVGSLRDFWEDKPNPSPEA